MYLGPLHTTTTDSHVRAQDPSELEWIGPMAFKARCGAQPGVDRDFGMRWGARHEQRISHRRATLDAPTGLLYAFDPTWDEYAILAVDVPVAAVEAAFDRAMATDIHLTAAGFAALVADPLTSSTASVALVPLEVAPDVGAAVGFEL